MVLRWIYLKDVSDGKFLSKSCSWKVSSLLLEHLCLRTFVLVSESSLI